MEGKLFYAEAAKGYIIKVMLDVLGGAMSRTSFRFTKKGIFNRAADPNKHILFDIVLKRSNFKSYICKRSCTFSLNLNHIQKMVKNVKKKDSVILFIDRKKPDKLGITIRPEGGNPRRAPRKENIYITIQREEHADELLLPEVYKENDDLFQVYRYPMVIDAPDFQKIKKMASVGKVVSVRMQKSNYISFYCDAGEVYSSELEFGEILDNPESDSSSSDESDEEESDEETSSEEESSDEESSDEEVSESEEESDNESNDEEDIKGLYKADFHMSMFSLLVKLPGLCSQMQFYSPVIQRYPLKIQVNAGTLGEIKIFIKDTQQIAYEESIKRDGISK